MQVFAKYHSITADRAKEVMTKYMLQQHSKAELQNPVRHLPLEPFDDDNIANIYHVINNIPKGTKQNSPGKPVRLQISHSQLLSQSKWSNCFYL